MRCERLRLRCRAHGLAKGVTQHCLAFFRAQPRFGGTPVVENLAEVTDRDVDRRDEIDLNMVGGWGRISVGAEIEYLRGHALLHESHCRQNVRHRLTGGIGCRVEQDEALLFAAYRF